MGSQRVEHSEQLKSQSILHKIVNLQPILENKIILGKTEPEVPACVLGQNQDIPLTQPVPKPVSLRLFTCLVAKGI